MELKQFSEGLLNRLKGQIEQISLDQPDVLLRNSQIISSIEALVIELKRYVVKYKFESINEEVEFFKTIKPVFISQLLFYKGLFKISLFESFHDSDARINYYRRQLKILKRFMIKHEEFYHYALSNSTDLDEKYFVRDNNTKQFFIQDNRFSTWFDNRLSRILANELIKNYIFNALEKIKSALPGNLNSSSSLTWTGSKTDLIELVYALQASGVFNKSTADVKQIASHFESSFNVTLGNYYRTFQEIRLRKTGQVNFLNELREILIKRIKESDL
jgi:hypothetical protein